MPRLSKELETQIVEYYNSSNNITSGDIANQFNISYTGALGVMKRNNLPSRRKNESSQEVKDKIVELYNQGKSTCEIEKIVKLANSNVCIQLRKAGVKIKSKAEQNRKYSCNKEYFKVINDEHKAYWLGFIYADGCIHNPSVGNKADMLTITLQASDNNHLEKLKSDLKYTGPVQTYFKQKYPTCNLKIRFQSIVNDLKSHGINYNKSLTTKFPKHLQPNLYRHFIRGYFDGDGGIYINIEKKRYSISICGTKDFLYNIQKIWNEELEMSYVKIHKQSSIYSITKGGRLQTIRILKWLYKDATIYLDRKYNLYKSLL